MRAKDGDDDRRTKLEFDNLANQEHGSDKLPTPNRFKAAKEENKSIESSSKLSLFPAVHTDNKDALKNILNSIPQPKKNSKAANAKDK